MGRIFWILPLFLIISCSSYEEYQQITEEYEIPSQVYKSEYTQSWQTVLQVVKKYDLAIQNQDTGVIKTRWIDNTAEINFADSFGGKDAVKTAKFKLLINVIKGFKSSREVTKVTVYKRQMIEKDFLQGWKVVRSDGILEKTILYRIEKTLLIENKLKKIEEKKTKKTIDSF